MRAYALRAREMTVLTVGRNWGSGTGLTFVVTLVQMMYAAIATAVVGFIAFMLYAPEILRFFRRNR